MEEEEEEEKEMKSQEAGGYGCKQEKIELNEQILEKTFYYNPIEST